MHLVDERDHPPSEDSAEVLDANPPAIREDMAQLFRGEALAHYQRGRSDEGHLLEIEPVWMRLAYGVILALLAAVLLFFALVPELRGLRG